MVAPKIMIFIENLCFRLILERVRCWMRENSLREFVDGQAESALRVISRGNIGWRFTAGLKFRGQGEVGAKLKLNTDMRLAPFNLDLLEISSYEFSWGYGEIHS